jgi:O-acetyl-ADP-ribose deacetylase (regulator of RNase III)
MQNIKYIKGDATTPLANDNKIILHICNDIGGWGKGFVMAISAKWKEPEQQYRQWYQSQENFALGKVQFVQVEDDIWIANLIGQRKINKDENGNPPIRYEAVAEGLEKVAAFAKENNASIHMPRIGCGLAGGKWEIMEPIIINALVDENILVTVYDF